MVKNKTTGKEKAKKMIEFLTLIKERDDKELDSLMEMFGISKKDKNDALTELVSENKIEL